MFKIKMNNKKINEQIKRLSEQERTRLKSQKAMLSNATVSKDKKLCIVCEKPFISLGKREHCSNCICE